MGNSKFKSDTSQIDDHSDALVALYLTEDTGLPCNTKDYEITTFRATDSEGTRVETRALKVTFQRNTSIQQQLQLLTFGSDDQRCNVILKATEASPVHCKVYAQLNSGPDVLVIDDTSANGIEYLDEESRFTGKSKKVLGCRVAARSLCRIQIGRNMFTLWPPPDRQEMFRRERWFRDLDPIPVTEELLREQLLDTIADYRPIAKVGEGGMGDVFQYMELKTGLMIAVKEEEVGNKEADERVQKEIRYMQSLKHPSLVGYIASNTNTNAGVKKWFTAMPLYQGRLCDILPLTISAIEEVMLQLFDGVHYMHGKGVLHKDIKPENILVKRKSRPDVVLADYGICASLSNRAELMSPFRTRGYAAPEVVRMIVQTPAVDVFALGGTFFTILEPERFEGPEATVTALENVARRPPKVYGGLIQSMMAPDPRERPSLKECFDIVRAKQLDWKKPTPLTLLPSPIPFSSGPRRSQRIQHVKAQEPPRLDLSRLAARRHRLAPVAGHRQPLKRPGQQPQEPLILDPSRFAARRTRLSPVAESSQPQRHPGQQQAPERYLRVWDQVARMQGPAVLIPQPSPTREPQPPALAQQVDFSMPPPVIPNNPFADLSRGPNIDPPTPSPARNPRKPDNNIKRRIRRNPERRQVIERWHRLRIQKNKICHAANELASGHPLNLFRGLRHITEGGLGLTGHTLGLIFRDLTAARPALHHIAPQTKRWGLNTNKRLMYGLKSQGLWPMTPEEYEAERLQSELDFPNTTEGKRVQAELDRVAEYWRVEKERDVAAEREFERRELLRTGRLLQPRPSGRG